MTLGLNHQRPLPLKSEIEAWIGPHKVLLPGKDACWERRETGEAEFSFPGGGGGGSIEPSGRTPLKKGSIDRTPKILPRLTPGPRR